MTKVSFPRSVRILFRSALDACQSPLLLIIRLYWGWQFTVTGWGKLAHLGHVSQYFASLNVPLPGFTALEISLLELCGGILMAIGLCSRSISVLLAADMVVAYLLADLDALKQVFSNPGNFYAAAPFTFLLASVIVAVFGAGVFSVDYLIERRYASAATADGLPA